MLERTGNLDKTQRRKEKKEKSPKEPVPAEKLDP